MSAGYVVPVDPIELASRLSNIHRYEDTEDLMLESLDAGGVEALDESLLEDQEPYLEDGYEDQVLTLLDRIPEREADLIYLYYCLKKRQADIAAIFEVTQAAISYRLARGLQRIKFLLELPSVTDEEIRKDLPEVFPQEIDVDILVGMWKTTCQSEVASMLGLTQGRVRHRFFKAVDVLGKAADANEKYRPYHEIFNKIASKKFNILREVKLPQWANRGGDACV